MAILEKVSVQVDRGDNVVGISVLYDKAKNYQKEPGVAFDPSQICAGCVFRTLSNLKCAKMSPRPSPVTSWDHYRSEPSHNMTQLEWMDQANCSPLKEGNEGLVEVENVAIHDYV